MSLIIKYSAVILYFTIMYTFFMDSATATEDYSDEVEYWKKEFFDMQTKMKLELSEKYKYQTKIQETVNELRSIIRDYQDKVDDDDMSNHKNKLKNTTFFQNEILQDLNNELLNLKIIIKNSKERQSLIENQLHICQSEKYNLTNRLTCILKKSTEQFKLLGTKNIKNCESLQKLYYELNGKMPTKRFKNIYIPIVKSNNTTTTIIHEFLNHSFCKNSTSVCKILKNGQKFENDSVNPNLVTSLRIENVVIEPGHLFQFLNKSINLSSLILNNVTLLSEFKLSQRVNLPKLIKFVLNIAANISDKENFRQYLNKFSKSKLKSLLFFDKPKFPNWNIEDLLQLETDIHISIDSVTILKIDKAEGELTSMILFTNDILQSSTLQSSNFNLQKLFLAFVPDLDVSIFPNKLTHLNLFDVGLSHGNFSDLLIKCQKLIDLRVFLNVNSRKAIRLEQLPPGLKTLTIDSETLIYSPVKFILNKLTLFWCHLSSEIVSNFLNIFNVNKIAVHMLDSDKYSNTLLIEFAKSDINEIIMTMSRANMNYDEDDEAGELLTDMSVEDNWKTFILERNLENWSTNVEFVGREFLENSEEWLINDYKSRFEHFTTFDGYKRNKIF